MSHVLGKRLPAKIPKRCAERLRREHGRNLYTTSSRARNEESKDVVVEVVATPADGSSKMNGKQISSIIMSLNCNFSLHLISVHEPSKYSWKVLSNESWKILLQVYENNQQYIQAKMEDGISLQLLEMLVNLENWFITLIEPPPTSHNKENDIERVVMHGIGMEEWWQRENHKYQGNSWYCLHNLRQMVAIHPHVTEVLKVVHNMVRKSIHSESRSVPRLTRARSGKK